MSDYLTPQPLAVGCDVLFGLVWLLVGFVFISLCWIIHDLFRISIDRQNRSRWIEGELAYWSGLLTKHDNGESKDDEGHNGNGPCKSNHSGLNLVGILGEGAKQNGKSGNSLLKSSRVVVVSEVQTLIDSSEKCASICGYLRNCVVNVCLNLLSRVGFVVIHRRAVKDLVSCPNVKVSQSETKPQTQEDQ